MWRQGMAEFGRQSMPDELGFPYSITSLDDDFADSKYGYQSFVDLLTAID